MNKKRLYLSELPELQGEMENKSITEYYESVHTNNKK